MNERSSLQRSHAIDDLLRTETLSPTFGNRLSVQKEKPAGFQRVNSCLGGEDEILCCAKRCAITNSSRSNVTVSKLAIVGTCLWHVCLTDWLSILTSQSDVPTLSQSRILTHPHSLLCKALRDNELFSFEPRPLLRKKLQVNDLQLFAERTRFELVVGILLRQFSKLVVSATHPPLQWCKSLQGQSVPCPISALRLQRYCFFFNYASFLTKCSVIFSYPIPYTFHSKPIAA